MKVTHIRLVSPEVVVNTINETTDAEMMVLPLKTPSPGDKFHVKAVFGLDADELVSRFLGRSYSRNSPLQNMSMKPREIAIRFALHPNWENGETYSDLRDQVYRLISVGYEGRINVVLCNGPARLAQIEANVSKVESALFSETPEMQLTLKSKTSLFRSIGVVDYEFETSVNGFTLVDAVSTAPHGFEMEFQMRVVKPSFSIYDSVSFLHTASFGASPTGGFLPDDIIYMNSEPENRQLIRTRGGTSISIADSIHPDSIWPTIFPHRKNFFWMEELLYNQIYLNSIRAKNAFWGV